MGREYLYVIIVLFCTSFINAQSFIDHSYLPSDEIIGNPERGFYHQVGSVKESSLLGYKEYGVRLILLNYDIKGYHSKPLPTAFLRNLQHDFDNIRNTGMKIIVRFAYSFSLLDAIPDAPKDIVLLHIEQLKPIFQKNSDVVLTFQAGFIGTWGEWWNTKNFAVTPGNISEENWIDRREVVDALLDMMPEDRMIQLRTPLYKKHILQEDNYVPITNNTAYDGLMRSRLAHHNDCFVAGDSDWGTYKDTLIEKPFLHLDSKYTFMGGETCHKGGESNCENALKELKRFHWSFLNLDYHQGVLSQWKQEGCYDEVERKLGYRYELLTSNLQVNTKPGGTIDFNINIKNKGWANPNNKYDLQLILISTEDNTSYSLSVDEDLRLWPIDEVYELRVSAGIPEDMPIGDYKIYLAMRDSRLSLKFNPDYSIQFANQDIWDANLGNNDLQHTINISNDNSLPNYTGEKFFISDNHITVGFNGPDAMKITSFNDNNIIYWSSNKANSTQRLVKLQRSVDNGDWTTIATQDINEISFVDRHLQDNRLYSYRVQYIEKNKKSEYTIIEQVKTNNTTRSFVDITLDGETSDWDIVEPVVTGYQESLISLKLVNDSDQLFFNVEYADITDYEISLNTDNNQIFIIRNDSLYERLNNELIYIKNIIVYRNSDALEGSLDLNIIKCNSSSLTGKLSINQQEINDLDNEFYFLKYEVLYAPENFKIKPSVVTPLTKLKISWNIDSKVEGYIIERSIGDKEHYEVIKDLGASNNYYLDRNLDSTTKYFYRMFKYSDIIRSAATDDIEIRLDQWNSTHGENYKQAQIEIIPNPMSENANLNIQTKKTIFCHVSLLGSDMKYISSLFEGTIDEAINIPLDSHNLSKGVYFIKIENNKFINTKKLVVY